MRRKDPIVSTRNTMYGLAKLLGDAQAVRKGTVTRRVRRRLLGRALSRLIR